ncbi:MAG: PAS domain S-box protein [Burkholderiales bacterium]|nr:PAS domain S-box protein [Burkholderiales bacterium]
MSGFAVRNLTLRRAIVLAVVAGLLLPAILIVGYSYFQRYDYDVRKRTQEALYQHADVLASGLQEALWNVDRESGNALLTSMMRNEDIVAIDVRDNNLGIFVVGEKPERRQGYTLTIERKISYRKTAIGSVKLEVSSARQRKIIQESMIEYLLALGAQIMLALILILILLDQRLVRPLRRLAAGAEKLASGALDTPFTWHQLDEIGHLSQRLEKTRISLRNLFAELAEKNQQLQEDIEKRKQVETELREREARIRALVEQSPIAIIEWDLNFCVIEWNSAAERIFGYTREQALGRHASFIVPQSARASGATIFQESTITVNVATGVNENMRSDGKIIICQWNNSHIANESGRTGRLLSMAQEITEQRRAEEARHWSEAKFAGAFQCYPDSVSITRFGDGVFLDINQAFEVTTGYTRAELLGKNAVEMNVWVNLEERVALHELLTKHNMVSDFSWSLQNKAGEMRRCLINATLFYIGVEAFMLAVVRDVTDQLRFEARKAEADRALLRLAQGTQAIGAKNFFQFLVSDLAAALGTTHAFIALKVPHNPERLRTMACYAFGEALEEMEFDVHGTPSELILIDGLSVFEDDICELFPHDAKLNELRLRSFAGAPLKDTSGNAIGMLAVQHMQALSNPDLVRSLLQVFSERAASELERKRAEEALRNSERSFSTIFHSSPVAMSVIAIEDNFRVKDVNIAFEQLFLTPRATVIGRPLMELGLHSAADEEKMISETLLREDAQEHHEIWMTRGDGKQMFMQVSQNSFCLMEQRFVTSAFEDITEKFNNELAIYDLNINLEHRVVERTDALQKANKELASTLETLSRAQEDLVRSEKLAALGSLVAGIAHELNTPIGNSLMVASTLVDQTREFAANIKNGLKRSMLDSYTLDAAKAGDILVRNLLRAADLVTSFKQVAIDQTSSQRRRFVLDEVIGEILLTLWPAIKKTNFQVVQEIAAELMMDSYPGPLGQVVTNLINNALIHGFEGRTEGTVRIHGRAIDEHMVELILEDDGIGIPAENLKRIYDPFFTTKLGAGGSGLGLNITHNIVTGLLGGRISVHSEVGSGTQFILLLPLEAPMPHNEDKPVHPMAAQLIAAQREAQASEAILASQQDDFKQ